jgi:hypothetical protein
MDRVDGIFSSLYCSAWDSALVRLSATVREFEKDDILESPWVRSPDSSFH